MAQPKKARQYRYAFVDPKTRHFVVAGTPGAVRKRIKLSSVPFNPKGKFRDAKGRFATPRKSARSKAAKKAATTRALKRQGITRLKSYDVFDGHTHFDEYALPDLTVEAIEFILRHVKQSGVRFLWALRVVMVDEDEDEFQNSTPYYQEIDPAAPSKAIKRINKITLDPSDPKANAGKYSVVRFYIVIRYGNK